MIHYRNMSTPSPLRSLSVFIPCYNEAFNLPTLISQCAHYLPRFAHRFEVIIVDDGSQDHTQTVLRNLKSRYPFLRSIHHPHNQGYGLALRSGFAAARYQWTFFTDGDNQFSLSELKHFLPFTATYSVIIGYRKNRAEGQLRAINARLFKIFIDLLFRVHVRDIDCAFKLIRSQYLHQITFQSTGATINAELLYKLKKMHLPFKQLPVSHYPRRFGQPTGNQLKVILKAGYEAIKLYLSMKFKF